MKEYIELVAEGKDLTEEQAKAAMEPQLVTYTSSLASCSCVPTMSGLLGKHTDA